MRPDMASGMRIHLDKLPIKRLESIEENGSERFPPEVGPDEKRIDQIRRIDFSFAVERDTKKAKKASKETASAAAPWPWQRLVDYLQSAHEQLSIIIDLINTVEANDAVSVAGMTRPKPLSGEVLADMSVSAATKLQRLRHLGKYFKQSSKALEQQVARETRFYSSLIRLQQNWKVKRQRQPTSSTSGEDFVMDLLDISFPDMTVLPRSSSLSIVRVDRDTSGMLTVLLPSKSCRFLHFGFLWSSMSHQKSYSSHDTNNLSTSQTLQGRKEMLDDEDINECVKKSHSFLREIHQAIFDEQIFELVNRETLYQSSGVNVIGMQEDLLQLGIGQEASVLFCLSSSEEDNSRQQISPNHEPSMNGNAASMSDSFQLVNMEGQKSPRNQKLPNPNCFLIYLQHLLLENVFRKSKEKHNSIKSSIVGQSSADGFGLLGHFCMSIAHRLYSSKVLAELENLAAGVPYLHLVTHPTWHSRISSWSLSVIVPKLDLHAGRSHPVTDKKGSRNEGFLRFLTKVVVTDERINITGEGAPNVIDSYGDSLKDVKTLNCYGCDLADLPAILLQQVTSQVIRWLHEEALVVGIKAIRDFLGLYFGLGEGSKVGLVAHVDADDKRGCISWWLIMDDGLLDEIKPQGNLSNIAVENRRFLGHLSLEELYSLLMDLISLCSSRGSS